MNNLLILHQKLYINIYMIIIIIICEIEIKINFGI